MKAYFVDAGVRSVLMEYVADTPRYEMNVVCDLIYAPTAGRAKTLLVKANSGDLGYTDILSCHYVGEADRTEGPAELDDPLWELT